MTARRLISAVGTAAEVALNVLRLLVVSPTHDILIFVMIMSII
jgi:hypothetical protein